MSTVIATSVLPDSTANDTLTIGATGDSVVISGDSLNLNTLQDAGGNTTFVSDGSGSITSTGLPGAMKFISSQTASGASSVSFTSGLDSTYDVYVFKFININPASTANFSFQAGSGYNTTMTTTLFNALHYESDITSALNYVASWDQAQGTAYQILMGDLGAESDECGVGELHLFNPSSTTYVKNFYSTCQKYDNGNLSVNDFIAGYFNTTSAITQVAFKMSSGNFDGTIALYGISKT